MIDVDLQKNFTVPAKILFNKDFSLIEIRIYSLLASEIDQLEDWNGNSIDWATSDDIISEKEKLQTFSDMLGVKESYVIKSYYNLKQKLSLPKDESFYKPNFNNIGRTSLKKSDMGWIYIKQDANAYKIGGAYTKNRAQKTKFTDNPRDLKIVHVVPVLLWHKYEKFLHKKFMLKKIRKDPRDEWFNLSNKDVETCISSMDKWKAEYEEYKNKEKIQQKEKSKPVWDISK
jgi:hypothetical protein